MKTGPDDEGIRAVRDVRKRISSEFAHDPKRLVEHYMAEQKRHAERLLRPAVSRGKDPAGPESGRGSSPTD